MRHVRALLARRAHGTSARYGLLLTGIGVLLATAVISLGRVAG